MLINWTEPEANDFFLASQVWVESNLYKRRPDLVGFVNGMPLLLLELKAPQEKLSGAYDNNLSDYRDTIQRFLHSNGFVILSNGHEAVMGSSHAAFEEFAPWKKLDEAEPDKRGWRSCYALRANERGSLIWSKISCCSRKPRADCER